jgi:two-component system, chemotaxis family, CheB/CheR fusion protein
MDDRGLCGNNDRERGIMDDITRVLEPRRSAPKVVAPYSVEAATTLARPIVYVVDDDGEVRDVLRALLEDDGLTVEDFAACEDFLQAYRPGRQSCLLIDANLPGMKGLELLQRLHNAGDSLPAIMITGGGDVAMAVQAMKQAPWTSSRSRSAAATYWPT